VKRGVLALKQLVLMLRLGPLLRPNR